MTGGMIYTALKNTTTVTVSANDNTIVSDTIENELYFINIEDYKGNITAYLRIFWSETIQAFLDNVVSVEILDQLNNSILQGEDYCLNLFRYEYATLRVEATFSPVREWKCIQSSSVELECHAGSRQSLPSGVPHY